MNELLQQNEFLQLRFPARLTEPLAIAHATLIPMDTNRALADHTLVVEDGIIRAIGPSATIDVTGMKVVDGRGQYVLPGLADMYGHYREPAESPLYLAHGITAVRTSGGVFQLALEWSAARGDFPSPWMTTVNPPIDGLAPTGRTDMPGGIPMTSPDQAPGLVERFKRRGYHQIMPFSRLLPENLKALGEAAAAVGLRVAGNCPNAVSWEEAVGLGMTGFVQLHIIARDHMLDGLPEQDYWDRFDPEPGTKLDFDKIRRLAAFMAEQQAWSIPTVVFHQRASQAVETSMAHPSLRYARPSTIEDWESTIYRWSLRGRTTVDNWRALARERAKAFVRCVGIFHEEGAPQLTGTDSLNPYIVQGDSLHQELDNFVAAGMRPYDALRCATSEAARFLGESDRWGTLAVGKRADLFLAGANPLDDICNARDVQGTIVNGYYLSHDDLSGLLDQYAELVKTPPEIASTKLPGVSVQGTTFAEGTWTEMITHAEFGQVSYRHQKLASGDWLIEERHAGANPRSHPERRNVSLTLAPDLTLRSGTVEVESFVGKETATLTWNQASGYTVTHLAVDGFEATDSLPGAALVPSERLAMSLIPRLIAQHGAGTLTALDVSGDKLSTAEVTIARVEDAAPSAGDSPAGAWKVNVVRVGLLVEQTYELGPDGQLIHLDEMLPLLWPRELIPVGA